MRQENVTTQTSVELEGTIDRIRFRGENGFAIAVLLVGGRERIAVKGQLGEKLAEEDDVRLTGTWVDDPKWGRQFQVLAAHPVIPTELDGIARWLERNIEGIGPRGARYLVDKWGADAPKILEDVLEPRFASQGDPLLELPGMSPEKAAQARACYAELGNYPDQQLWLAKHGVVGAYAGRLVKNYKAETRTVLEEDPYKPMWDVDGFGFKRCDDLAKALGVESGDPRRARAAVLHAFEQKAAEGHVYLSGEDLEIYLAREHSIPIEVTRNAVRELVEERDVVDERGRLYHAELHRAEVSICYDLIRLLEAHRGRAPLQLRTPLPDFLNGEQKQAVMFALAYGVVIVTGGPGRGKTTVLKTIEHVLRELLAGEHSGPLSLLMAPTGKAAKRMTQASGIAAKTIHRALEYGPDPVTGAMGFRRNRGRRLEQRVIFVDEASMLDTELAAALFQAIETGARVVLFGDVDQLPSVGPGAVLKDLIATEMIPVVRLVKNMRQAEGSAIATIAGKIVDGRYLDDEDLGGEVTLLEVENPETAAEEIVRIVAAGIPGYTEPQQVQVLCPKRIGPVGAEKLNVKLQQALNPKREGQHELALGDMRFRAGDKVIVTRNNYDLDVFNGDTGLVRLVDEKKRALVVALDDGRTVTFERDNVKLLQLAYAISVHRSQGSEYPVVVMPIHKSDGRMVFRNLFYTALTRARERVVLVGQEAAIRRAIKNQDPNKRNTTLYARLPHLAENPGAFDDALEREG